jgi:hypothetical protein
MSSSIPPGELSKYAPKWVREGTAKPRDTVSLPPAPQLETMPSDEPPWRGPSPFAGDVRQWRLRPSAVPQVVRDVPVHGSRREPPSFAARFFKTAAVVSFAVIATGALGLLLFPNAPREVSQVRSSSILAPVHEPMSQRDKTVAGKSVAHLGSTAPAAQTTAPMKPVGSTIYVVANTAPTAQPSQVQQPQAQTSQVPEPQPQQAQTRAAAPSTSSLAPQRIHSERILSPDELDKLIARGEKFIEQGDVSAARLVLERAAQARDPRAALALGSTYDPNVLGRLGVVGVQPEPEKARLWYEKAAEFGSGEANQRLTALAQLSH